MSTLGTTAQAGSTPASPEQPLIALEEVTVHFGEHRVLHDLSLAVRRGGAHLRRRKPQVQIKPRVKLLSLQQLSRVFPAGATRAHRTELTNSASAAPRAQRLAAERVAQVSP